jgi:uncharacterized protein
MGVAPPSRRVHRIRTQRRIDSSNRRLAMGGQPLSQRLVSGAYSGRVGGRNPESPEVHWVRRMVPVRRTDLFPVGARVVFHLAYAIRCWQSKPGEPIADRLGVRLFHRISSPQRAAGSGMDVYPGGNRVALGTLCVRISLDLPPTFEYVLAGTRRHDSPCRIGQVKVICLILKAPRPGIVKTRLARDIGDERATAIYRALVEHQAMAIPPGWQVTVYFTPADAADEMEAWLKSRLSVAARFVPQCDGDLGQRLAGAVSAELQRGATRIFLIGGDCPGISRDYLSQADEQLSGCDLVIGPATDGGYVLLGLKNQCTALFENIAWSTQVVLDQTVAAARRHSLSIKLLPILEDIDDAASLARQARLLPFQVGAASTK